MLDSSARIIIDPPLNYCGNKISALGITANQVTLAGFVCGILACMAILTDSFSLAAFLIILNRICDGLDGAVARNSKLTDFGGFADIVSDFIIYSGIVFAFGFTNPLNLKAALFLIFSFIGPISSFLAYAIIAAKRKKTTEHQGKKSFYYLSGICEGTETALILLAFCIFPSYFSFLAIFYGILCWMTTFGRIYNAWIDFG